MQFKPKTEQELAEEGLLEENTYPFSILECSEKQDKKGMDFFAVKLGVHYGENRVQHVYDNVSPNWMAHKLRHLCFGTGLGKAYEAGSLSAGQFKDRQGHVEITIEPAKNGYAAKNVVVDYVVPDDSKSASQDAKAADAGRKVEEDDVPF